MTKPRLSRADWITAALGALATGGVTAVAVDPIANALGVTRGSFYWHFENRADLLRAALDWWEHEGTTSVIERVEHITDPHERLRTLFFVALSEDPTEGLEPALVAHADDPIVAPVLNRVTARRIDFLTQAYTDAGLPPERARLQAVVTYSAYVGWTELRRATPDAAPETVDDPVALRYLIDTMVNAARAEPPGRTPPGSPEAPAAPPPPPAHHTAPQQPDTRQRPPKPSR
ncbi:DNA-binding transcriptional regulator, AcrR family [Actinokineospora alba]|uniref:DNA-binding transcriptional regulator, AcrR family n=1 Tax=Actinokineospora alba TaxID=504798 RepID=A0A1H0GJL5_9PSEU|nr:TetR family transcriptional regulator [Actinokineospora alba]SDI05785.1 DNA-binding transcriptional regulator, AcrR family [Actinokineospora alba]SDO07136.1 DNA-binding transcriptional regulator, AcrR family [Actinokineospora alba]